MICQPCADEADLVSFRNVVSPDSPTPKRHAPAVCRDAAIPGRGCTCQHGGIRDSRIENQT